MPQSQPLRLGTRGSKLALVQANMVAAALRREGAECEIVIVKTSGDRIQDRSLADAGGKGLFVKELEEALAANMIDLAVHSMKDVPVPLPPGFVIGAYLPREDPREAFVSLKAKSLAELAKGARIGTSSVRRHAQIARARGDLEITLLRGNVDTRLAKLDAGSLDGMLLAHAGLKRLGLESRATSLLAVEDWLPSLGQGAIGIEIRENDETAASFVSKLNDKTTAIVLACERAFQSALDGSCRSPIAGLATFANSRLSFRGEVIAPDGSDCVTAQFDAVLDGDAEKESARLGREAGEALRPRAKKWLV